MSKVLGVLTVTSSGRPVLFPGDDNVSAEIEILLVEEVSIYINVSKKYRNGQCWLTNHRILWIGTGTASGAQLALFVPLAAVRNIELESKLGFSSPKIVLFVSDSGDECLKLSFHKGKRNEFLSMLSDALKIKAWKPIEKKKGAPSSSSSSGATSGALETKESILVTSGAGIAGIQTRMKKEQKEADQTLATAFKDLDALMSTAQDLVDLAERYAASRGKESKEDEGEFNLLLSNLGIVSPVTKESAGTAFHAQLARQLSDFIQPFIVKSGGMLMLIDAFCMFNRARGTELISPEDLLNACKELDKLNLPVRMQRFASGVCVLKLAAQNERDNAHRLLEMIEKHGPLTALQYSQLASISVSLAKEQIQATEQMRLICRDQTFEAVTFYPNKFF
jgi:ESCRT-II complex subunit VPS36